MPVLYYVPIFHGGKDEYCRLSAARVAREIDVLEEVSRLGDEYMQQLIPSFFEQLRADGLINKKKKFTGPVSVFVDGLSRPGTELLRAIQQYYRGQEIPFFYKLVTRLHAAGGVVRKTELSCLLGHGIADDAMSIEAFLRLRYRLGFLRETYIARRIQRDMRNCPDGVAVLLLGAGHPVPEFSPDIEVKVFHRADLLDRKTLSFMLDGLSDKPLPMFSSDDFGHVPQIS